MHHYGPYWHPFDSPLGDNYTYIPVRYRRNDLARLEKRLSAAHFFLNINVFEKILESVSYLDTLSWRAFEELVADLLQSDGYAATLGRGTKDEGIDIIATREFEGIGQIMSIWQAKKLKPTNKVEVAVIRELAD